MSSTPTPSMRAHPWGTASFSRCTPSPSGIDPRGSNPASFSGRQHRPVSAHASAPPSRLSQHPLASSSQPRTTTSAAQQGQRQHQRQHHRCRLASPLAPLRRGARFVTRSQEQDLHGLGLDVLTFLGATVVVVPAAKKLNVSPVLAFLASGFVMQQLGLFQDLQDMEKLSEFGVLFLLFEMGLELSLDRLKALAKYAFGMGSLQMFLCTSVFAAFALPYGSSLGTEFLERFAGASPGLVGIRTLDEAVIIGAALSMSSSAFVLQLLRERGELSLRFGSAILGILLFQDIAVVPFLVLLPLVEGNHDALAAGVSPVSLIESLGPVALQTVVGLGLLLVGGRVVVRRIFQVVAESRNAEAFVALCLLTVTGASLLTQSLGFSDTLGAFIAGVLLSETNYKTQVEADISAFRGLLLGLFFVTTGSSINLDILTRDWRTIFFLLVGLLVIKTTIIMSVARPFGLTRSESIRTGFLLSQSGEFAFVLLSLANQLKVLPEDLNQLLIIVVVLSMALTPGLAELGKLAAEFLERKLDGVPAGSDSADLVAGGAAIQQAILGDPVVICGFGPASQMVVNMLASPLAVPIYSTTGGAIPYIAFDLDPARVRASRLAGFSVVFGDGSRTSVLHAAGVKRPRALVVNYSDPERALKAVESLRKAYPEVDILASAVDLSHAAELEDAGATCVMVASMATGLDLGTRLLDQLGVADVGQDAVRQRVKDALRNRTSELAERLTQMPRALALAGVSSHADVFVVDGENPAVQLAAMSGLAGRDVETSTATATMDGVSGWDSMSDADAVEVAALVRVSKEAGAGRRDGDGGAAGGSGTGGTVDLAGVAQATLSGPVNDTSGRGTLNGGGSNSGGAEGPAEGAKGGPSHAESGAPAAAPAAAGDASVSSGSGSSTEGTGFTRGRKPGEGTGRSGGGNPKASPSLLRSGSWAASRVDDEGI